MNESRCEELEVAGQKVVRLHTKEGDEQALAEIYLHGAHVTRFEKAGQRPYLFLSERTVLDGSKPIRGGIPIIFPQFGSLGPLPNHGFARNVQWTLRGSRTENSSEGPTAVATFELRSSIETKKIWPYEFDSEYTVRLVGAAAPALHVQWRVTNTDRQPIVFTCALHTYFSVENINSAIVSARSSDEKDQGLAGIRYVDQLQGRTVLPQPERDVLFTAELDRIYLDTPPHLLVLDRGARPPRCLHLVKRGLADAVVWNPWVEKSKSMADLHPDDFNRFLCVEAAAIHYERTPAGISLQPREEWEGSLQLSASFL